MFWPWEGSNYPSRSRSDLMESGPKGPKLKKVIEHGSTDPSFCPVQSLSPSPNNVLNFGAWCWYIVRRMCTGLPSPPPSQGERGVGDRRWLEGCLPSISRDYYHPCSQSGLTLATFISPRTFVSPFILHPINLQWFKRTESVLMQQGPKQNKLNTIKICDMVVDRIRYPI